MGTLYVVLAVVGILFIVRFIVSFKKIQERGGTKQAVIISIAVLIFALVFLYFIKK
jgi:hypothetical protein